MRQILTALAALAAVTALAPVASAQSRNDQFYHNRDASLGELRDADARLNRVYQRRISEAQRADRDARYRRPRGWYGQESALRNAERMWIAYRDADCRYAGQSEVGSRSYQFVVRACMIDRTNDRIAVLQDARTVLSER
ncbi:MAG: lysozyme inhibitor LprI family protein [Pseudomonadota bacterium]